MGESLRDQPGAELDVSVECSEWRRIPKAAALCREAAVATLRHVGVAGRPVEIAIVLADDGMVRELNRRYRGQDKPTNVLSFPGQEGGLAACPHGPDAPPAMLGDIILASGTVFAEADSQGKPVADHLRHLVVHGVLHLLGFDHEADDEAERMEAVEKTVLGGLGIPDPYDAGLDPVHA